MSLASMPGEVWDCLNQFIRAHHRARLVLTGDPRVRVAVIRSRRHEDLVRDGSPWLSSNSPLVRDALVLGAISAVVTEDTLAASEALKCPRTASRLRHLTCRAPKYYVELGDGCVDARRLSRVETWKFGEGAPILVFALPSSLTSLTLTGNGVDKIANFGDLVNLRKLALRLHSEDLERFDGEDLKWPPHLTSFRLHMQFESTYCAPYAMSAVNTAMERAFRRLPPTLLKLRIDDSRAYPQLLDVVPPAVCTRIESFKVYGKCEFRVDERGATRAFPCSLKRLAVRTLCVTDANDPLLGALAASSISEFWVWAIDELGGDIKPVHWFDALTPIVSRTETAERLELLVAALGNQNNRHILLSPELSAVCVRAFARLGLSEHHFEFVKCMYGHATNLPRLYDACDAAQVKRCLAQKMTRMIVQLEVARRTTHFEWAIKLGLMPYMTAVDISSYGDTTPDTVRGVTRLIARRDLSDFTPDWDLLLGAHTFPDVTTIVLDPKAYGAALTALSRHRSHFPALEMIDFSCIPSLTPEQVDVLASMRMYQSTVNTRYFLYRVCAPPARRRWY